MNLLSLAHDLANKLAAVSGFIELQEIRNLKAEQSMREAVQVLHLLSLDVQVDQEHREMLFRNWRARGR